MASHQNHYERQQNPFHDDSRHAHSKKTRIGSPTLITSISQHASPFKSHPTTMISTRNHLQQYDEDTKHGDNPFYYDDIEMKRKQPNDLHPSQARTSPLLPLKQLSTRQPSQLINNHNEATSTTRRPAHLEQSPPLVDHEFVSSFDQKLTFPQETYPTDLYSQQQQQQQRQQQQRQPQFATTRTHQDDQFNSDLNDDELSVPLNNSQPYESTHHGQLGSSMTTSSTLSLSQGSDVMSDRVRSFPTPNYDHSFGEITPTMRNDTPIAHRNHHFLPHAQTAAPATTHHSALNPGTMGITPSAFNTSIPPRPGAANPQTPLRDTLDLNSPKQPYSIPNYQQLISQPRPSPSIPLTHQNNNQHAYQQQHHHHHQDLHHSDSQQLLDQKHHIHTLATMHENEPVNDHPTQTHLTSHLHTNAVTAPPPHQTHQQPPPQQQQQQQQGGNVPQWDSSQSTAIQQPVAPNVAAGSAPSKLPPRQRGELNRLHAFKVNGSKFLIDSRYHPKQPIGRGAYGVVCSGIDTDYGLNVAIKRIPNAFRDVTDAKRILREAELLHAFNHPHIITLYDVLDPPPNPHSFHSISINPNTFSPPLPPNAQQPHGFSNGNVTTQPPQQDNMTNPNPIQDATTSTPQCSILPAIPLHQLTTFTDVYVVMELMECDLHKIIYSSNTLSEDHIAYLMYQALRGLHYMHLRGVIHRDIKPSNLLLNQDCSLKICDLGLSRILFENQQTQELTEYVVTRWYRAPEIMYSLQDYDFAIDTWSIGCILAELYLRKPLFPGDDYIQQLNLYFSLLGTPTESDLEAISNVRALGYIKSLPPQPPIDLSTKIPNASPAAIDLLQKLLRLHPKKRISIRDALQHPFFAKIHAQYPPLEEEGSLHMLTSQDIRDSRCNTISDIKNAFLNLVLQYRPWVRHNLTSMLYNTLSTSNPQLYQLTARHLQHPQNPQLGSITASYTNVQDFYLYEQFIEETVHGQHHDIDQDNHPQ